jgi:hypothetical protein
MHRARQALSRTHHPAKVATVNSVATRSSLSPFC